MRLKRLKVKDFRGIDDLDVEFAEAGVTIVEGRNEIGKTSMADALWQLLDEKDSSGKRSVKATQPVGRDVGPLVEAELAIGPYRLTYRKQWIRDRLTELEISAPQPQKLTGDEAHNRMTEILESETDIALFWALRYQQGVGINQAELADAPSLLAALDAAAGGAGAGASGPDAPDALFERVDEERLKYFAPAGAVRGSRKEKKAELDRLAEEVSEAEAEIRDLDDAAERRVRIEEEIRELELGAPALSEKLTECKQHLEASKDLQRKVEQVQNVVLTAEAEAQSTRAAADMRADLKRRAESATEDLAKIDREIELTAPALAEARAGFEAAEAAAAEAKQGVSEAETLVAERKSLADLFELRLARDQFQERAEQVREADDAIAAAQKFLVGCRIDGAAIDEIEQAKEALAVARGRAEAGHARLQLEALRPTTFEIDGETHDGVPGRAVERSVAHAVRATIGDLARVTVTPPEGSGEAEAELERAERRLAELLSAAEVESVTAAHEALAERSRQEGAEANAEERRTKALRDLSAAELGAKLERSEERLAVLEAEHDGDALEGSSREAAIAETAAASEQLDRARVAADGASTKVEAARRGLQAHSEGEIKLRTRREAATTEAQERAGELARSRAQVSDDDLVTKADQAEERLAGARSELERAEAELEAADPESAKALVSNAEAALERHRNDLKNSEVERATVQATLDKGGLQGLSDRRSEAEAKREDLKREVDSEDRRAAAVKRLYEVLARKRAEAQRAFAGPFSDKINSYARILFGPDVAIKIDDQKLAIESRSLGGTTIAFEALSGGAKEQLAVLTRLACAALVSSAADDGSPGGVPVIIDDALGYSDPDRLEKLGAAFSVAGRDCQVIVLTCEPNRYREVGDAKVVKLG